MSAHAPLAVFADLSLHAADGQAITVTATESVITVALPRLWSRQGKSRSASSACRTAPTSGASSGGLRASSLNGTPK